MAQRICRFPNSAARYAERLRKVLTGMELAIAKLCKYACDQR